MRLIFHFKYCVAVCSNVACTPKSPLEDKVRHQPHLEEVDGSRTQAWSSWTSQHEGRVWKALPKAGHISEAWWLSKKFGLLCGHFMHRSRIWDPVSESCSRSWQVGATLTKQWLSTFRCTKLGAHFWSEMGFFWSTPGICLCMRLQGLPSDHVCAGSHLRRDPLRWISKMLLTPGED